VQGDGHAGHVLQRLALQETQQHTQDSLQGNSRSAAGNRRCQQGCEESLRQALVLLCVGLQYQVLKAVRQGGVRCGAGFE
jgi:hypothetical protein